MILPRRRYMAEVDCSKGRQALYVYEQSKTVYDYWSIAAPYYSGVLLQCEWDPFSKKASWVWFAPEDATEDATGGVSDDEVELLRDALIKSNRRVESILAGDEVKKELASQRERNFKNTLLQTMVDISAELISKPSEELSTFLCRTDDGVRVHSWGSRTADVPMLTMPGGSLQRDCSLSGIVSCSEDALDALSWAEVAICDLEDNVVTRATIDDEGVFEVKVQPGSYKLRFEPGVDAERWKVEPSEKIVEHLRGHRDALDFHVSSLEDSDNDGPFGGGGGAKSENTGVASVFLKGRFPTRTLPVFTLNRDGEEVQRGTVDCDGHYRFEGLKPGAYVITPVAGGRNINPGNAEFELCEGEEREFGFELAPRFARKSLLLSVIGALLLLILLWVGWLWWMDSRRGYSDDACYRYGVYGGIWPLQADCSGSSATEALEMDAGASFEKTIIKNIEKFDDLVELKKDNTLEEERKKRDEQNRLEDEQKKRDEQKRLADEQKKIDEQKRLADEQKARDEQKMLEDEQKRLEDEQKERDEQKRLEDEQKTRDEQKMLEDEQKALDAQKRLEDEQKKLDDKKKIEDQKRLEDEAAAQSARKKYNLKWTLVENPKIIITKPISEAEYAANGAKNAIQPNQLLKSLSRADVRQRLEFDADQEFSGWDAEKGRSGNTDLADAGKKALLTWHGDHSGDYSLKGDSSSTDISVKSSQEISIDTLDVSSRKSLWIGVKIEEADIGKCGMANLKKRLKWSDAGTQASEGDVLWDESGNEVIYWVKTSVEKGGAKGSVTLDLTDDETGKILRYQANVTKE